MVRGTASLPHGIGKEVRVLGFVTPDKEQEAKEQVQILLGWMSM